MESFFSGILIASASIIIIIIIIMIINMMVDVHGEAASKFFQWLFACLYAC